MFVKEQDRKIGATHFIFKAINLGPIGWVDCQLRKVVFSISFSVMFLFVLGRFSINDNIDSHNISDSGQARKRSDY